MAGNTSKPGESVAARLFTVLRTFDSEHREQRLTDIAQRSDLPVPTADRMVSELTDLGVLTKSSTGEYSVGSELAQLGRLAPAGADLEVVVAPFLEDLQAATDTVVHLAIRDGLEVIYVARLPENPTMKLISKVGSRLPLHTTGVGKVLLAYASDSIQDEVFSRRERLTSQTIVHPNKIRAELARIRESGYSQQNSETSIGTCSVAVPLYGVDGEVIAAIGAMAANLRSERARLVTALWVAANGIHRALGSVAPRRTATF